MKYAKINERYGVLYDHAEEFPQFKGSNWILLDLNSTGRVIYLYLVTEETFIDECHPDITREEINAKVNANDVPILYRNDWYYKKLHQLSKCNKIKCSNYEWAITMFARSPFSDTFSEIGNTIIPSAEDAYDAYLHALKKFPDFNDFTENISPDCWYCDIVQKGAAKE